MLDEKVIAAFRRRRFADALAELCVEQGFRATTVGDIVARARTSRNTFYKQFANKDEAFHDVLDRAFSDLFARVEAACNGADRPERRTEAGLAAVLAWVSGEPALAWVCLVEAFCSTPEAMRRYLEAIARFATLLQGSVPTEVARPRTTEESLVGGVASILSALIRNGEARRAPDLLSQLTVFVRGPFLAVRPV